MINKTKVESVWYLVEKQEILSICTAAGSLQHHADIDLNICQAFYLMKTDKKIQELMHWSNRD
jgi:hypothetical protein